MLIRFSSAVLMLKHITVKNFPSTISVRVAGQMSDVQQDRLKAFEQRRHLHVARRVGFASQHHVPVKQPLSEPPLVTKVVLIILPPQPNVSERAQQQF